MRLPLRPQRLRLLLLFGGLAAGCGSFEKVDLDVSSSGGDASSSVDASPVEASTADAALATDAQPVAIASDAQGDQPDSSLDAPASDLQPTTPTGQDAPSAASDVLVMATDMAIDAEIVDAAIDASTADASAQPDLPPDSPPPPDYCDSPSDCPAKLPRVGSARCDSRACVIETCEDGWSNADGKADNGCEQEVLCEIADCPKSVERPFLQLWLRGDKGVTCDTTKDPQRISLWADQSGKKRHAYTRSGQLGPYCGVSANQLDGKVVPFFPATSVNPADDTLSVDLGFLANSDFTAIIVERRLGQRQYSYMLGTDIPNAADFSCVPSNGMKNANRYLGFYTGYRDNVVFRIGKWDDNCDMSVTTPDYDGSRKPAFVNIVQFSKTGGTNLYVNGLLVGQNANTDPIQSISSGYIGRAYQYVAGGGRDTRFLGNIAEIIIYNKAISEGSRIALQNYLKSHWSISF